MAQSLLINLDEFNAIPPRIQQGFLKNVMQLPTISDILADPSGCRRFIGIENSLQTSTE